ncbi:unnamed protein product [Ambrosiozyma monospora]|uniref:Unnamed protein product n=1 Tax=Ambrosiozyma monospora TaxID=43982 RepID=A0A9W6T7D2_AMBMO|nr:unnamed protein product [Ambrosiozyma monospora]
MISQLLYSQNINLKDLRLQDRSRTFIPKLNNRLPIMNPYATSPSVPPVAAAGGAGRAKSPVVNPYGRTSPAYGRKSPVINPYGRKSPVVNPYGRASPAQNPYAPATISGKPPPPNQFTGGVPTAAPGQGTNSGPGSVTSPLIHGNSIIDSTKHNPYAPTIINQQQPNSSPASSVNLAKSPYAPASVVPPNPYAPKSTVATGHSRARNVSITAGPPPMDSNLIPVPSVHGIASPLAPPAEHCRS